jgi:hypothetical protein
MDKEERVRDGKIDVIVLPTRQRTAKRIDGERDVLVVEGDRGGVQVQSFSFPLDFYLRKQFISRAQWLAGNRFHKLWSEACRDGYVQFQYRDGNGGPPNLEFVPPGAFAAEYREALKAIRNECRKIAYTVCCEGLTLRVSRLYPSPRTAQRHGMPLLLSALDDLIRHFRY